ncbi:hypothetical protein EVAR_91458_1 [Eumeta japonica]|uniref:Uncharacterized protein n=1 Tax=Eumeta variegata TaxID=151549 RepID=A0A4C1WZ49_EUMVA|nr:hypothetical protein EVAR_91458_1 [Eumeta japonica]
MTLSIEIKDEVVCCKLTWADPGLNSIESNNAGPTAPAPAAGGQESPKESSNQQVLVLRWFSTASLVASISRTVSRRRPALAHLTGADRPSARHTSVTVTIQWLLFDRKTDYYICSKSLFLFRPRFQS